MTILDLFAEDAEARAPALLASDHQLRSLAARARELWQADQKVKRLKKLLELAQSNRTRLSEQTLPSLMTSAGTDQIGVPDGNCDVVLRTIYHANIAADWDVEDRERGFAHLSELGGENLIRSTVSVSLPAGDLETAQRIAVAVKQKFATAEVSVGKSVPWGTLTAFVRSKMEQPATELTSAETSPPVDLKCLGATVSVQARVEARKAAKARERAAARRGAKVAS